jgi:hypothetical protein
VSQQWIELDNGWIRQVPPGATLMLLGGGNDPATIWLKLPNGDLDRVLGEKNAQGMSLADAFQFFKSQIAEGKPLIRQPCVVKP